MNFKTIILIVLFICPIGILGADLHVSPKGNDDNSGTADNPLRTIQAAVDKIQTGDICFIHTGTYRENINIKKSGIAEAPVTLQAAIGENPVISGLDILSLKWKATDKNGIFVADYKGAAFEQLFMNGKPMLQARWPNVPRDKNGDWDFFSPNLWAAVDSIGNNYGVVKDAVLAATGLDVTGATAILNVSHQYFVWTRTVESHSAGSNSFGYPKNLGSSVKVVDESGAKLVFDDDRYYLIGKKEFLDASGEWFYDSSKKQLFVCMPEGKTPQKALLEVKTRNYSLTASANSNYITIDGLTFFGTAFSFGSYYEKRSNHITFKNNTVLYSSWTEYFSMPKDDPNEKCDKVYPTINADNAVVSNNIFAYGAMSGLYITGISNLIENNLFHDFNLNSSLNFPPLQVSKPWEALIGKAANATVRYNTIYNSGGIAVQVAQADNDVCMNDLYNVYRSCWGGNKDVSALYTQNTFCTGTRLHHNWVHEGYAGTPPLPWGGGMGIRGDDKTAGLTIDHNVIWNIGSAGIELKNPDNPTTDMANRACSNTIFQHSKHNKVKSGMIVETHRNNCNQYSSVVNNLSESIYGHWFARPIGTLADYSCNVTGKVVEGLLEDPLNFDFRPKTTATDVIDKGKVFQNLTDSQFGSAPDIGAYERGDSIYRIPGRREVKASFPIVPNGSTVSSDRDVLMWRSAYQAVSHQVYFGTDAAKLSNSVKFTGEKNVFPLPKLVAGQKYFWRMDAIMEDGSAVKGDVWSFNVAK